MALSSIVLMYICMGTLQNIYFNMKDSGHFDKCNSSTLGPPNLEVRGPGPPGPPGSASENHM